MMEDSNSSLPQHPETETEDDSTRFTKSLQELKDLCSQLRHAADYCESTFLNSNEKQTVVENTKEYVCRAVVTVVDHLGSVSANLNYQLSKTNTVSQTELRINFLNQKLISCQEYSHKLALAKLCWKADTPRFYPRYISPPNPDILKPSRSLREQESQIAVNTMNNQEFKIDEEVPLFLYTYNYKPSLLEDSARETSEEKRDLCSPPVMPVRDGMSVLPKPQISSFQLPEKRKGKRNTLFRKSVQNNDILSLLRRKKSIA